MKNLRKYLIEFYKKSKFVKILNVNTFRSGNVLNTIIVKYQFVKQELKNKYVIFAAIDNLVKVQ